MAETDLLLSQLQGQASCLPQVLWVEEEKDISCLCHHTVNEWEGRVPRAHVFEGLARLPINYRSVEYYSWLGVESALMPPGPALP